MKIGAVILNYNDSLRCIEQAKRLVSFNLFNKIIIVDNCSNIEEKHKLDIIKSDNIKVLFAETNRGYGAGNNIGLKELFKNGFKLAFLVNTDIIVYKESVVELIDFMLKHNKCGAVTCPMIERGKIKRNFYDFPTLKNSFFDSITIESNKSDDILNKKHSLQELKQIFINLGKKCHSLKMHDDYLTSEFIRESCTLYDLNKFKEIDYFDEEFFLYEEGPSIGMKFKERGYFVSLDFKARPHIHDHKGTFFNRKTFAAIKKSRIHFFKKYQNYPKWKILMIKIFYINVYLK